MAISYIAEIGNNHNGDILLAKKMADAALLAGADYVKFQIYNLDKFIDSKSPYYKGLAQEGLSFDDFRELKKYVNAKGGKFLATPFDEDSLNLLDEIGLDAVKISSGDMNNRQLLQQAVRLKKRLIISVGGATINDIDTMVKFLRKMKSEFSVLHCVLSYPARFKDLNLNFIRTLTNRYSCPVGYSDHSLGVEASLAAIALGASIIEKHFTIDRSLSGGDNQISALPDEFKRLRSEGDHIEKALGSLSREFSEQERKVKRLITRKFFAKRDIAKGAIIHDGDLLSLRTEEATRGLSVRDYGNIIGKRASRAIKKGEILTRGVIDE